MIPIQSILQGGVLAALWMFSSQLLAQGADVAAIAPVVHANEANATFMMWATVLVTFMAIPGLALFYGGLVRSKNALSVLMQVFMVFSLIVLLWAIYGYSLAFGGGDNPFFGSLSKVFLLGVTMDSVVPTFTQNVFIPEYLFITYQSTFAGICCAIVVGSFAERIKFSAVLAFMVIWFTFSYIPIAHMIWDPAGFLKQNGGVGIDFAGGNVVHLNAAMAGLVGSYFVSKRMGYGQEAMPPHNLTFTMVGACMLWVGWFGFNAGSNLEASGSAFLAFINTMLAAAAAVLSWSAAEALFRGKASMLGAASGAVAGLVAITPACGNVGPMGAIVIGLVSGVICMWAVSKLKKILRADDTLDVFGIHGIGGILGGLLLAFFNAPELGGQAPAGYSMMTQFFIQLKDILVTACWSGVVSVFAFKLIDLTLGLRVKEEAEREGLDIHSHGERAYND